MSLAARFELLERLYDGRATVVHRGRDRRTGAAVVVKAHKPASIHAGRLRHEHKILESLDLQVVVAARELVEQGAESALVLDDVGGETLDARLRRGRLPLAEALRIGIGLAEALGQVHRCRVVHKDVNPSNVLLDAADHVRLIDFDIATRLPREIESSPPISLLSGTLPYISPEQTGRMNRAIDHRTDLYSLGVTLYEMLTGRLPFVSRDPMEIVHGHIARTAAPPTEVDPSVPRAVSDIVMRLLEKTAEARYQSAFGLKADLEACLSALEQVGTIEPFPLGAQDISDRLQIPQKLYGRDKEIGALQRAFARAQHGGPELLLVTGSSGVGKSSIVHELYRELSSSRGTLVSGKFDQLKRDIPYSALLTALSELVRALLAEPEEELAVVRSRIQAALRGVGRVLTDVLPELVHLIGPQPPVPELGTAEARIRFRLAFERFIQVFTGHGRPLVLFLDDMQWADAATLDLLPALLGTSMTGALLVIGATRDGDVLAGHSLLATVAAMQEQGCRVNRIAVPPLSALDVREFVQDTLSLEPDEAAPLAELLRARTDGNPLLVGELLTMLHRVGLIRFDPRRRRWTFDLDQIERAPGTDNVGQLMAARAATLDARTQEVLKLAAVLGHRFDLETLAVVAERPPSEVRAALDEALRENVILCVGRAPGEVYRFVHDRVQQAVYASIPEAARVDTHYRAGKRLLQSRPRDQSDDWLFEVLSHLNLAAARAASPEERIELARLNLAAAKRARAAVAFAAAGSHYAAGIRFVPERERERHRELLFEMHLGQVECDYVVGGERKGADEAFDRLLQQAQADLDRVRVYELIAIYTTRVGNYKQGLSAVLKALELLKVEIDPKPTVPQIMLELLKTRRALAGRSPEELLRLPVATDVRVRLSLRMLFVASALAYLASQSMVAVISARMVQISVEQGYASETACGYSTYAVMLARVLGDYDRADKFGRLALRLSEMYPEKAVEVAVKFTYGYLISPWKNSYAESLRYIVEARDQSLMSGNLVFAGFAAGVVPLLHQLMGAPMGVVRQVCEENLDLAARLEHSFAGNGLRITRQMLLALQGLTRRAGSFDTPDFNEAAMVARLEAAEVKQGIVFYRVAKSLVLRILGFHQEALAMSEAIRGVIDDVVGTSPLIAPYRISDALLLAREADRKGALSRQREIALIRMHLRKLKAWAEIAPMNYRSGYLLVAAELARLRRQDHLAIGHYEEAIAIARSRGGQLHEGTALECAGAFFLSRDAPDLATTYLARARRAYASSGMHMKVALLDEAYPGLASIGARAEAPPDDGDSMLSTVASARGLDVPTMIKASQALSGEVTLESLLLRLMHLVAENAGAERGALVLQQKDELLVVAEFTARGGAHLPDRPIPMAESTCVSPGIVNYVLRTCDTITLSDATREGAFAGDAHVALRRPKSVICAPLVRQGEVCGALYLENNLISGAFTVERAELLGVLCAQMAISVDNALLYADLDRKVEERTRALEAAQAKVVQLEKQATEARMAGGFAHEMRNALAGAGIALAKVYDARAGGEAWSVCAENSEKLSEIHRQVREEVSEGTLKRVSALVADVTRGEQELAKVLRVISQALSRGLGITRAILEYGELNRERPGDTLFSAQEMIDAVLSEIAPDIQRYGISVALCVAPQCTLVGKEMHYRRVLRHLLLNACEALSQVQEGSRELSIHVAEDGPAHLVLEVRDTGVGVPEALRDQIFEPFFTTNAARGMGLGLGVARKLVALYGGTVELDTTAQRGATFRVRVPRHPGRRALAS